MLIRPAINASKLVTNFNTYQLLLDLYPNATAAFSLRKLRSGYTGKALRIRRSGDNAEFDFGFNGVDFDKAGAEAFCVAGGGSKNGYVVKWYDQSGNSYDGSQSTAANQPQIIDNGTCYLLNGKPAIYFNNTGGGNIQYLNTGTNIKYSNTGSHYAVASYINTNTFRALFANDYASSNGLWIGYIQSNNRFQTWAGNQNLIGTPAFYSTNTQYLNTSFFDYTSTNGFKIYKNNSLDIQATFSTAPTGIAQNGSIGFDVPNNAYEFYGYMQEQIFYLEKTTINNSAINTLINSYYGIY